MVTNTLDNPLKAEKNEKKIKSSIFSLQKHTFEQWNLSIKKSKIVIIDAILTFFFAGDRKYSTQ